MATYYVNKIAQPTGEHEVHTSTCSYLPDQENRMYLGVFSNCHDALREAKRYYNNVDGCYWCSRECHRR